MKSCLLITKLNMKLPNSLKRLIVSTSRIKLLQTLFYSAGEMFYVRQLTRLTGEKINAVRRELSSLKEAGILESEWRGNRLYYWVNKKHLFFNEILALVLKTKGLGKEIIDNQQRLGKIKFVIFSGKFARGIVHDKDEVDLLIVGKVVLPELGALVREEEKIRKHEINYSVMEEKEFRFRKENRDPFLIQIMLRSRIMVVGDEQDLVDF